MTRINAKGGRVKGYPKTTVVISGTVYDAYIYRAQAKEPSRIWVKDAHEVGALTDVLVDGRVVRAQRVTVGIVVSTGEHVTEFSYYA